MKYVGEIFKTNNYGNLIVTSYTNTRNVNVKFIHTGYETVAMMKDIIKGCVKDKSQPSVYGVGVIGDEIVNIKSVAPKEYKLWNKVLERCYDIKYHNRYPTYFECSVSENFKYYPYFKERCNKQIGFNSKDDKGKPFNLDKDILIKGGKLYSEDICVFVPREVNALLIKREAKRGECLIGVCHHKRLNKFMSMVNKSGKPVHLGYFSTELEAFLAYKEAKEDYIKVVANKWKDQIDPRAYEALMNYQVEITD